MPELWKFFSEIRPGAYRVETSLSRTWKVSTLEHLAPANIRSRALQTELELQNQCFQLEKLKSSNSSLRKELVVFRQELDNYCNKTKEAKKEVLGKCSAVCEALRDNLKAAAARKAKQEQSIEVLKQELADLNVRAAKKGQSIENMEKMNDQLRWELEQLEHYNHYLANECRKKILSMIDKRELLETKKPKQGIWRNIHPRLTFNVHLRHNEPVDAPWCWLKRIILKDHQPGI